MNRSVKLIFLICLLVLAGKVSEATEIKIGLYRGLQVESIVFSTVEGTYILFADGRQIAVIEKGAIFHIDKTGSLLEVRDTAYSYGTFKELEFKGTSVSNIFQVKAVFPFLPAKESDDNLNVSIYNDFLRLINTLELEKYIPGTVEAEGGSVALPEYYKAQAIITRTFAIKNFYRHAQEGYNLCDGVHCQAFNGKSRMNKQIYSATRLTANEILVNKNGEPVVTAYHANCGGTTASASIAWNRDLSYLVPVHDPFCDHSSHLNWTKTMSSAAWNDYMNKKGFALSAAAIASGEQGRQKYLDPANKKLLLTEVRNDLGLKSSWFHIETDKDSVIIRGHGYGHGLGLCQQGAMEMARVGFSYVDILMFYFSELSLKVTGE